jgi:MFS family permease
MIMALGIGVLGALAIGLVVAPDTSFLALLPGLVLISVGDGATFTTIFIAAATAVPDRQQGIASGIVSTASGIGAAVGLVVISNIGTGGLEGEGLGVGMAEGISRVSYSIAFGIMLTLIIAVGFRLRWAGNRRVGSSGELGTPALR